MMSLVALTRMLLGDSIGTLLVALTRMLLVDLITTSSMDQNPKLSILVNLLFVMKILIDLRRTSNMDSVSLVETLKTLPVDLGA